MKRFSLCAVVVAAIWYYVAPFRCTKDPGCIGMMNGVNVAKVEYVGGYRIMPINP